MPRFEIIETGDKDCQHREVISYQDGVQIGLCRCGRVKLYLPQDYHWQTITEIKKQIRRE